MKKILIWDLPVRIFHWAFAGSLLAALGFAFLGDKHSAVFRWHMLGGIAAGFLLLLRVIMGLVGSRYARFSRMPVRPTEVIRYFRGVFTRGEVRHPGHNPGSALAALAMFVLVPLLFATGLVGGRDPWEEVHASLAYGLSAVIGAHLVGLLWHAVRHRENVAMAMIAGRKAGRPEEGLTSAHPVWAVSGVLVAGVWIGSLLANHDAAASRVRLPFTGTFIQLGESEGGTKAHPDAKRKHHADHHDE
jgi:cytochrome b